MRYEDEDYRRGDADVSTKLTYLLIGGGIGAILALLFAPKSGHELRGDLADATRKGLDRSREMAGQIGERAGEYYGTARERAGELYDTSRRRAGEYYEATRERAGELRERAGEVAERARERAGEVIETAQEKASAAASSARGAAARKQSQVSAALDAGRKAYEEEKRRTESSALLEGGPNYGEGEVN
jgi:gas vesicle protein